MANKVLFGVSNLHVGLYDVSDEGVVTLGTPIHVPGTVNISLEAESEENTFYADNVKYWTGYSDNGYTGEIAYFCNVVEGKIRNEKNPATSAANTIKLIEAMKSSADEGGKKVKYLL